MCLWKLEEARGVFNHAAEPFCGDTVIFDLKKAHFAARFPELCDQFPLRQTEIDHRNLLQVGFVLGLGLGFI